MREKLSTWKIPALVNMLFVSELLVKNNDKKSFDDQEMCKRWKLPCLRLTGSKIFRDKLGLSAEAWKFIQHAQQIAAKCINLLPAEIPFDINLLELGFDSLQLTRFIGCLKLIDLKSIGIDNEKFKKALDVLSVDDFKNIETLLALYKYLQSHSLIFKRQSDDREGLIKRLPSKSSEKFMLTDCRIYNNESYGEIDETIWWVPSILGNASLDYGTSKILQLPLHNYFLECPDLDYLRQVHSLHEIADHYVKRIISSRGFVFLGGWSSGGLLSKIIKEKLQKQGVKVILFLIDTVFPERLQQMNAIEFALEIYDIAKRIRGSILLLLSLPESTQFNIPSLDELSTINLKENQLTQLIGHIKVSFTLLCKSNKHLDDQAVNKCLALIEYVHIFLKAEIDPQTSLICELHESDIFIVSDGSVAKYGKNLGWKINSCAQVEIMENTDHFSLLHNVQLVNFIKKRIIKELIDLMEPYYQGLAYNMSGKYILAVECFNEVQLKNSGHPQYLYFRAVAYMNMKNYEKAFGDLTQFIGKFPDNIAALSLYGRALICLERNIEAVEVYLKILQMINDVKEIRKIAPAISLACLAVRHFDSSFAEHPSIQKLREFVLGSFILKSYFLWGEAKYKLMENDKITDEVVDLIDAAIRNDPENKEAYISRADINLQRNKYIQAKSDLDKAVSLGAEKEKLIFYYGMIKYNEEQFQEAVNLFSKVIVGNNDGKDKAYHFRGLSQIRLNQINEAIKDLTSAYDISNDTKSLIARGNAYHTQKMFENAYNDFVKAIELGADNVMVYYRAALSAKEIIRMINSVDEIGKSSQLYAQSCKYLVKAIASLGEGSSALKKQIESELSNMQKESENFKKKHELVIVKQFSGENVSKKPSAIQSLRGIKIFDTDESIKKQKQYVCAPVERHKQDDTKLTTFMPSKQS
jgi:tetratricopeptide (TPR) repeat protein